MKRGTSTPERGFGMIAFFYVDGITTLACFVGDWIGLNRKYISWSILASRLISSNYSIPTTTTNFTSFTNHQQIQQDV
jgi:hypothetical protein